MLSEDKLIEIEELASCFFTKAEILEITGIEVVTREFREAMRKGQLTSEYKLRKSILELASDGSSPAQSMAFKMLETLKRTDD